MVSYNWKEYSFEFDYFPESTRLLKLHEDQLCLNLRQSSDGKYYRLIKQCLPIRHRHVAWKIEKDLPYFKLSICAKRDRNICGAEIEMKEGKFISSSQFFQSIFFFPEMKNRHFTPMIISIIIMSNILILIILLIVLIACCRIKNRRLKSNKNNLDRTVRP